MLNQDAHHSSPSDLTDIDIHDKDDLIILSSAINGNADIFITGDKERAGNPPQADFKGLICGNQFDWVHFLKRLTTYIHITILQTTS